MTDVDARESFRKPFLETALSRYSRIEEAMSKGEGELKPVVSELHCLSGEAAMLDFGQVADAARVAEDAARKNERSRLSGLLGALREAIADVEREGAE